MATTETNSESQCRCIVSLMLKAISSKKNSVLPIEKFPFPVLTRTIMLQHLIFRDSLYYVSSGCLKTKENFKLLALKVDALSRSEVVAYKRFQI